MNNSRHKAPASYSMHLHSNNLPLENPTLVLDHYVQECEDLVNRIELLQVIDALLLHYVSAANHGEQLLTAGRVDNVFACGLKMKRRKRLRPPKN